MSRSGHFLKKSRLSHQKVSRWSYPNRHAFVCAKKINSENAQRIKKEKTVLQNCINFYRVAIFCQRKQRLVKKLIKQRWQKLHENLR